MKRKEDLPIEATLKKQRLDQEMHPALSVESILYEITTHLNIADLYQWAQTCNLAHKVARSYFFGRDGIRRTVFNYIDQTFSPVVTNAVVAFQEKTGALLTGSAVLKVWTDAEWPARDLDLFVALNETSVQAFKDLVATLSPMETPFVFLNLARHDSLHVKGLQNPGQPACSAPNEPSRSRTRGKPVEDPEMTKFRELLRGFSDLSAFEEYDSDYNKHVRGIYYTIHFSDEMSIDVVFVPEQDVAAVGGLIEWMKYNFDFQICANAVTTNSAYCLAPDEIAIRFAFMRMDQYCVDVKVEPRVRVDGTNRWGTQRGCVCDCFNIVERRVKKYQARGYIVEAGTYGDYLRLTGK